MPLARCFLVVLLLGLTGCVGSRPISTHPPESLPEVNRLLAGREARVVLDDDSSVTGEGVAVFPDSVRFATGQPALPTSRVRRITYERERFSPGQGAGVGALVGLSVVGLCAARPGDLSAGWCLAYGGIAVLGGAILGALLGEAEGVGPQERVAYEGPVTRYGASVGE